MNTKLSTTFIIILLVGQIILVALVGSMLLRSTQPSDSLSEADRAATILALLPTDTPSPLPSPTPPAPTATASPTNLPSLTPTATPLLPTSTPLVIVVTATPTPTTPPTPTAQTRLRSYAAPPATATPIPTLLAATTLTAPPDGETYGFPHTPRLRWEPLKNTLETDELYLITIHFQHLGATWTDYAWTRNTTWSVGEHQYLLQLSDDGRFEWSVALISQTEVNADGVPQGPALSEASHTRIFYWHVHVPKSIGSSSPIHP